MAAKPLGRWKEESHRVIDLPKIIKGVNPNIDTYITQATFKNKTRRAVHVDSVGLLFVDLDTYNISGLVGKSPEEQANSLVYYCSMEGIPIPSIIMFSGRGLQAKWFLDKSLTRVDLQDWNAVQMGLVNRLDAFGSDRNSKDISRVLRLDHTVNTKSGEIARVLYIHSGVEAVPTRYNFDEMAELFKEDIKPNDKTIIQAPVRHIYAAKRMPESDRFKRLNWYRLEDIRNLWTLRGGVPEGYRELTLFWELNFLLLSDIGKTHQIWKESQSLAAEISNKSGWYKNSDLSTIYRKAKTMLTGEKINFQGSNLPALYTPRNNTIINLFKITAAEETQMKTIISKDEKRNRLTAKRRTAGIVTREEYINNSITKKAPWEALNISRATYYNYIKKGLIKGKDRFPLQEQGQTCLSYPQEQDNNIDPTMNEVAL